jgi:hypothetical protein
LAKEKKPKKSHAKIKVFEDGFGRVLSDPEIIAVDMKLKTKTRLDSLARLISQLWKRRKMKKKPSKQMGCSEGTAGEGSQRMGAQVSNSSRLRHCEERPSETVAAASKGRAPSPNSSGKLIV